MEPKKPLSEFENGIKLLSLVLIIIFSLLQPKEN